MGGIQRWGHFGLDDSIRPDIFVDVSAADVGRAGNSTQGRKCGSDILVSGDIAPWPRGWSAVWERHAVTSSHWVPVAQADALDEEEVAAMSARFMAASQGGESRGRGESIE